MPAREEIMNDWQPIETAPKDRDIIVFIPTGYEKIDIVRWERNEWWGDHWMNARCVDEGRAGTPTHWMELPSDPIC